MNNLILPNNSDGSLEELFGDSFIDSRNSYPEPEYTLEHNGVGFFALGNIAAITGKPKTGKSFVETMLISSMLGSSEYGYSTSLKKKDVVVLVDTDQSHTYTARQKARIQSVMGWDTNENQPQLIMLNVRNKSVEQRKEIIDKVVLEVKPKVIFIDNIAHMVDDFNDVSKCRNLTNWLLSITDDYNCLIVVVLHENKSQGDSNMKGHLGSFLREAAVDVLQVKKA